MEEEKYLRKYQSMKKPHLLPKFLDMKTILPLLTLKITTHNQGLIDIKWGKPSKYRAQLWRISFRRGTSFQSIIASLDNIQIQYSVIQVDTESQSRVLCVPSLFLNCPTAWSCKLSSISMKYRTIKLARLILHVKQKKKINWSLWRAVTQQKTKHYFHSHFISQTCNHSAITWQKPDKGRLCVLLKKTQGNYTKLPKTLQYLVMIRPFDNESSQTVALISHNPKLKRYYSCNPYIYYCVYGLPTYFPHHH